MNRIVLVCIFCLSSISFAVNNEIREIHLNKISSVGTCQLSSGDLFQKMTYNLNISYKHINKTLTVGLSRIEEHYYGNKPIVDFSLQKIENKVVEDYGLILDFNDLHTCEKFKKELLLKL